MGKQEPMQLEKEERIELEQLIRTGEVPARVQRRARILLLSDGAKPPPLREVAEAVMCSAPTVSNVRQRYRTGGLDQALHDRPRPGAKPKITGEVEAHLIALACSDPPLGEARWTLRLLADRLVALEVIDSISHVAVGDALKKMNLSLGA
jgi:transposase